MPAIVISQPSAQPMHEPSSTLPAAPPDVDSDRQAEDADRQDTDSPQYVFVLGQDQRSKRSHAMREHWKQRRQDLERKRQKCKPLPRRQLLPSNKPAREDRGKSIEDAPSPHKEPGPKPAERRLAVTSPPDKTVVVPHGIPDGIPWQALSGMNRALVTSQLDPFDMFPVKLTAQHHKLLHHWLSTYAAMMFEDLPVSTFNPMRDVWFPLDLSNAASFNAIMAHAAAHLARMRGFRTSDEALRYKREAIRIVTLWISNPERALGDDVFAAVLRLLTYERYWGTEAEWRVHRQGLQQMVEARGGIVALRDNWRLKLALFLVSLMSKPSWFDSSNRIWEISEQPLTAHLHPILGSLENLNRVRCLWLISFIQDLRTFVSMSSQLPAEGLGSYDAIREAMRLLEADFEQHGMASPGDNDWGHHESARLACVFFICVLLQSVCESDWPPDGAAPLESRSQWIIIDTFLRENRGAWQGSADNLYVTLFHSMYEFPGKAQMTDYVLNLTNVLGSRSYQARRGVERCLLHMVCQATKGSVQADAVGVDGDWTPDNLLSSLHTL